MLSATEWASSLNSLGDAISVHNIAGEIVWANEKLCELYSKPLSELTGLTRKQAFNEPATGATHDTAVESMESEGEITLGERVYWVVIRPYCVNGRQSGYIRVMRDVTSERRLQQLLLEAERFAPLGQMLFGIAHNVGTPLNIISGYAEFLLMRTKADEHGHKELSTILDQTRRITILLNEALDLARPGQANTSAIDIRALLSDSLDLATHYFRRAGIRTQLTCAMSPPLIYGKAPRLRQAFFSVVLNAGQSVSAGGRLEIVIAESQVMSSGLSVTIIGTDAERQGHYFQQALESLVADGNETNYSGIGLLLARETFAEAGAAITFKEFEERGVAVQIDLPVSAC